MVINAGCVVISEWVRCVSRVDVPVAGGGVARGGGGARARGAGRGGGGRARGGVARGPAGPPQPGAAREGAGGGGPGPRAPPRSHTAATRPARGFLFFL